VVAVRRLRPQSSSVLPPACRSSNGLLGMVHAVREALRSREIRSDALLLQQAQQPVAEALGARIVGSTFPARICQIAARVAQMLLTVGPAGPETPGQLPAGP